MLLKTPLQVKHLTLHNRLVLPPMASKTSTADGQVTDAMLDYYRSICAGGYIGLVITEHAYIHMGGKAGPGQMSVAEDEMIGGLTRLADTVHSCGSKVICQINHAGSGTNPNFTGGLQPIGPSAVGHPKKTANVPREMTLEEIKAMPALFAAAARRAKAAGFDGVEIHACHGYLLNQFYSPLTNHRTDDYGGSLDNRLRLICEVIRAVRSEVGADYPIALRLGGCDYTYGGSTIDDAVYACKVFAEEGVDLLDLSGGMCSFSVPGRAYAGFFSDMSEGVKAAVQVPVMLTGGVWSAANAEKLLQKGAADLIGVGRAQLRDHRWAEKALCECR